MSMYVRVVVRAVRLTNQSVAGRTVADFEQEFREHRLFVLRVRDSDDVREPEPAYQLAQGMVVALSGPREAVLPAIATLGVEVDDPELLDMTAEFLDVVVTNPVFAGKTVRALAAAHEHGTFRGVYLRKILRAGQEMPLLPATVIDRGDVLRVAGVHAAVERAAKLIGYADRITEKTDMTVLGLGIVIGALIGALSIRLEDPGQPQHSGGALIAGLVCGWLRSVNATFGRIPGTALWVFNNVGLNTFIAVVGITAGPGFVAGLKSDGLGLFLSGIFVTSVPFIIMLYVGKYLFKMHPGILLGACAGARTTTAALGAIEEAAKSKVPAMGYTVTYAVGNTLLIVWGVVIVLMMS